MVIALKLVVDNKAIRKRMIDLNIKSITELSRLSGVSKPKIHQYLNGNTPLATTYIRLCSFLELNPNNIILIEETNDKESGKNEQ